MGDKNLTQEEKNTLIEKIAKDNVDIKALGLYTLGGLRETIEKETLVKYHNLFEKYFLKSLTSRLTDYTSEKFEVINSDKKNAKYTIVNSRIAESKDKPEIKIDWRVLHKRSSKAFDQRLDS